MASLTTPAGISVQFNDNWICIDLNERGDGFFFFLDPYSTRLHLGRHWWGLEKRFDEQGREWTRNIKRLVVDDFGTLTEVAA